MMGSPSAKFRKGKFCCGLSVFWTAVPQGAWDHDQTLLGVDGHCPAMLYFRKSGAKGGSVVTGLEKRTKKHQALQFLIAKFAKFEV